MKRSKRWWFVYSILAPAILGGFLAGCQKVNAQLPKCADCVCKPVIRWWVTGMTFTYANGAKAHNTTTDQLTAFQIYVGGGCVDKTTPTDDALATYDMWRFQTCGVVCSLNPAPGIREMTCTDGGSALTYNLKVRNCLPPSE